MHRFFVMCAIFLACASLRGDDALSIAVTPRFCRDPCRIRIMVRVEPHAGNRTLLVETDSAAVYRSTTIQLEEDESATVYEVVFRAMPAGRYLVRASLGRVDGLVARVDDRVRVLGSDD